MKIVIMSGGLGNQLYQYAFLRLLEMATKEECIVDDFAFLGNHVEHNGYELDRIFGVKPKRLSQCFTADVIEEMLKIREQGTSILQQLYNNGIPLTMLAEFKDHPAFDGNIVYMPPNVLNNEILQVYTNTKGDFYYHGYWVRPELINAIKQVLRRELVFPEIENVPGMPEINVEYARKIKEVNSVAVHIRRGDFLKCGRAVSPEKYAKAVAQIEAKQESATYFVFSDDIEWCRVNQEMLGLSSVKGEVVYVCGNIGNGYNYVDMQLMSMCKSMIISNSSFGCWAYYLNQNGDVDVLMADHMV